MDCSMPGSSVLQYLLEFAQTHVHWVGDAIQSSHPLSSSYPPAFNPSQLQGLFQWIGSLDQVAKVLELQHQSFQWIFRLDFLWGFWRLWSLCCPKDSQESSPAPQFKNTKSSVLSFIYSPTLTSVHDYWRNHNFDYMGGRELLNKNLKLNQAMWWRAESQKATKQTLKPTGQGDYYWIPSILHIWQP